MVLRTDVVLRVDRAAERHRNRGNVRARVQKQTHAYINASMTAKIKEKRDEKSLGRRCPNRSHARCLQIFMNVRK